MIYATKALEETFQNDNDSETPPMNFEELTSAMDQVTPEEEQDIIDIFGHSQIEPMDVAPKHIHPDTCNEDAESSRHVI